MNKLPGSDNVSTDTVFPLIQKVFYLNLNQFWLVFRIDFMVYATLYIA